MNLKESLKRLGDEASASAKNSDSLEDLLEVPVDIADTTKSITSNLNILKTYVVENKEIDQDTQKDYKQIYDKIEFSAKAVRVAATILIQEIEKDLQVEDNQSLVAFVQSDVPVARNRSLCPLNSSRLSISSPLRQASTSKLNRARRSSIHPEMLIEKYYCSEIDS